MKKQLTTAEQREIMLNMMTFIDSICQKNDINYSLSGGTLLGAVRHAGFIPWDDDVDLMLVRSEYEKLVKLLKKEVPKDYKLFDYRSSENYQYVYAKFCDLRTYQKSPVGEVKELGVFIDIFPIDHQPDDLTKRQAFVTGIHKKAEDAKFASPSAYFGSDKYWKKYVKQLLFFPRHVKLSREKMVGERLSEVDRAMQQYNSRGTNTVGFLCSRYALTKEIFPARIFTNYKKYSFEDREFMGIAAADVYLDQLYPDFMKLPPEKDQLNHDYYRWYWKK